MRVVAPAPKENAPAAAAAETAEGASACTQGKKSFGAIRLTTSHDTDAADTGAVAAAGEGAAPSAGLDAADPAGVDAADFDDAGAGAGSSEGNVRKIGATEASCSKFV